MNLNKKFYLSSSIIGAISILLIVFLISPLYKKIKRNSEEFLSERKKIILLAEEKKNLKKLEGVYEAYQPDLDKIEGLLVNPEIPIDFIDFLEKNAVDHGVKIGISGLTKKPKEGDFWPSLSLQLSVEGSFCNFLKFLEKIENGPHLIEVTDLNIRRLTEKDVRTREFSDFLLGDTGISLALKVFSK